MFDDPQKQHGEAIPYESARTIGERPYGSPRRGWNAGEIVCWLVILLIVGLVSVRAAAFQEKHAALAEPSPQLPGLCKYAVAVHTLATSHALPPDSADRILASAEQLAKTPGERLRVAIVYGEFQGADVAADRLAAIKDPGDDPESTKDLTEAKAIYALRTDHIPVPDVPVEPGIPRFRERLGWFANLAISQGRPDTDPVRQGVLSEATMTLAVMIGGELFVLVAGAAGLALMIVAIVQLARGRLQLAFRRMLSLETPHADRSAYLQGFTFYLVLMLGLGYVLQTLQVWPMAIAAIELPLAFAIGLLWPLFRGESVAQWRATLGLHTGRGVVREIFGGIGGYLAGMPLMGIALLIVLLLTRLAGYVPTHPIQQELGTRSGIIFTFLLASVWAPVTEELMFRGALFASLRERYGWWLAAPVMAVVFAGVHPQGFVAVPVLAAIAVAFAGIREWRGSIIGSMAAHCLHNTAAILMVLFLMRS